MRDHILVSDGKNTVIVNQRSFCELIKWLLVEYLGVSYEAASLRVEEKADFFASLDNVMSAALESHNWPYYYTALDLYLGGHGPAQAEAGILPSPNTPEGLDLYVDIERTILIAHHLKEPIEWID